ncbi:MAG: transposase [Deltaproteobacteria bacterium]|nr:transposase [Deltaproteobacteria bacterium]
MLLPELKTLTHTFFLESHSIWRFLDDQKVEPTNNRGERDIREYVLRRKVSLHTWSDRGDTYLERALSVAGTCRKQGRSPFAFLHEAIVALRASKHVAKRRVKEHHRNPTGQYRELHPRLLHIHNLFEE